MSQLYGCPTTFVEEEKRGSIYWLQERKKRFLQKTKLSWLELVFSKDVYSKPSQADFLLTDILKAEYEINLARKKGKNLDEVKIGTGLLLSYKAGENYAKFRMKDSNYQINLK